MPKGRAIAIARAAQARWAVKSKNPAIRAASAKSLAEQHVLDHRKRGRKADMSNKAKKRTGSIPSGAGKGKFPITDQHSVDAAAHLIGRAKGVSKKKVIAHVKAEAKARGLKLPKTGQLADMSWLAFDDARGKTGKDVTVTRTAAPSSAGGSSAAASKTTASAAKVAAAKQAAAKKKAQAAALRAQKIIAARNAQAAKTKTITANAAAMKARGVGAPVRTVSMSTPIVGTRDGARMAGKLPFGGKQAAPFKKGGGRVKKINAAKIEMAKRTLKARGK